MPHYLVSPTCHSPDGADRVNQVLSIFYTRPGPPSLTLIANVLHAFEKVRSRSFKKMFSKTFQMSASPMHVQDQLGFLSLAYLSMQGLVLQSPLRIFTLRMAALIHMIISRALLTICCSKTRMYREL